MLMWPLVFGHSVFLLVLRVSIFNHLVKVFRINAKIVVCNVLYSVGTDESAEARMLLCISIKGHLLSLYLQINKS